MKARAWLALAALALNLLLPGFVDPATQVNPGGGGAGTAPTSASTSTLGYGKGWQTTTTGPTALLFDDDTTVLALSNTIPTNLLIWSSTDAGQTYTLNRTITGFPADTMSVTGFIKTLAGSYLVWNAASGAGTRGVVKTSSISAAASQWQTALTGLSANSAAFSLVQGSNGTIIVTREDSTVAQTCRSVNDGNNWICTTLGAGTTGLGNNALASPSAGRWVLGYLSQLWLSTNDGVSFTSVAALAGGFNGIGCITPLICLAASGGAGAPVLNRSTDGGATWVAVTTMDGASWGSAAPESVPVINFGGGVVVILRPQTVTPVSAGWRSDNFGIGWRQLPLYPVVPNGLNARGYRTPQVRSGSGIAVHAADTGTNPVFSLAQQPGTIGITQANPLNALSMSPVQGSTLFNSQTTGAANTAVVVTLAAVGTQRAHLYRLEASCSAGTSNLTVTDGGVTVWSTLAAEVGVTRFRQPFDPAALTGSTNSAMVITLATCGVGNTGTLIVHADRF